MLKLMASITVYLVIILLTWVCTKNPSTTQTMVVTLTGLVIIWYTYETYKLRLDTQLQTEISQRPFVSAKLIDNNLEVINIGNGAALNIYIKPIEVDQAEQILIKFPESIPVLRPGHSNLVSAECFMQGRPVGDVFLAHLDPRYANQELIIEIVFQNIELREYRTRERIMPGSRKILEFLT